MKITGNIATLLLVLTSFVCPEAKAQSEWVETDKLTNPEGVLFNNDRLGLSLAIQDGLLAVGAPYDRDRVLIYALLRGRWVNQAILTASDDDASTDFFGQSVALDDGTLAVGRFGDREGDPSGSAAGAVHMYAQETDGSWTETVKLLASDAFRNDRFGYSVALHGTTLVVGAYVKDSVGAAYVYRFVSGAWREQVKLTPSSPSATGQFGVKVFVNEDTLLVADNYDNLQTGAVYVYHSVGDMWVEQAKLTPSDGEPRDYFGLAVDIFGTTMAVGASSSHGTGPGKVYIFELEGGVWIERDILVSSEPNRYDLFGRSVALGAESMFVGAWSDEKGAVFQFGRVGGSWVEQGKLVASDGVPFSHFGLSSAFDHGTGTYVAGDEFYDSASGAVYVFEIPTCKRWLDFCESDDDCCSGSCCFGRCSLLGWLFP